MLLPSRSVYAVSTVVLLLLDVSWVSLHARPVFERWARSVLDCPPGDALPRVLAAAVAYALLGLALCVFVARPGQSRSAAFFRGAVLGLCLYGVFAFTNKGVFGECYPWHLVTADVAWGTLVFGAAAGIGAAVTARSD